MLSLADELGEVFSSDCRRKSFVSGVRDFECRSPDSGISLVHSPERAKSSSPQQIGMCPIPTKVNIYCIVICTYYIYIYITMLATYRNETLIWKLFMCRHSDSSVFMFIRSSIIPIRAIRGHAQRIVQVRS